MATKVTIDRMSFAGFPMPVPPLLLAFADWLEAVPGGGVGCFDALACEPLDKAFPDPRLTPALSNAVGIFLFLPDGSRLALWRHGAGEPAVVLLGSEGDLANVAPSLPAFLLALSQGTTGVTDLDEDTGESRRPELAQWLTAQPVSANSRQQTPDFAAWYEAKLAGREVAAAPVAAAPAGDGLAAFSANAMAYLGRTVEDSELRSFVSALGHWPLPRFPGGEDLYLGNKDRGYCLVFREVKASAGGKGYTAQLSAVFLHSAGDEENRAFAQPMPMGITWSDTSSSLVARLGPPSKEITSKKTGKLTSHRWLERDGSGHYVAVTYDQDGAIIRRLYLGIPAQV